MAGRLPLALGARPPGAGVLYTRLPEDPQRSEPVPQCPSGACPMPVDGVPSPGTRCDSNGNPGR